MEHSKSPTDTNIIFTIVTTIEKEDAGYFRRTRLYSHGSSEILGEDHITSIRLLKGSFHPEDILNLHYTEVMRQWKKVINES